MGSNSETIAISVPVDMFTWLEKPENKKRINRSQLFQKAVNQLRTPKTTRMYPMDYLIIVAGVTFGVSSMVISGTQVFGFIMNATFFLLGATILMASLVTFIKELRRLKQNQPHK